MADNKKRKDGQYLPTTYMDGMLTEWSLTVYIILIVNLPTE